MAEKTVKKFSFGTTSTTRWLEEKKEMDGTEGLWRIHDKLYDFTIWSRSHPGGKFWLDTSRGTDITEAFESHHFSNKAESLLQNYYIKDALTQRSFRTTFQEDGFYKTFKRRIYQEKLLTNTETSLTKIRLVADCLASTVILIGLLGVLNGIIWTILSGVLLGLLSVYSHTFLHMKENWRMFYFNLSLMSSREWRLRHVLSHHQYLNSAFDLETSVWQMFSTNHSHIYMVLNWFFFPLMAHIQFLQRVLEVFLSIKLRFHPEELVAFTFPIILLLFSGTSLWQVFVTWNIIIMTGSSVFCVLSSSFLECKPKINAVEATQGQELDFGILQLLLIGRHPNERKPTFHFLNSFRGNALHYLCPNIYCGNLSKLIVIFQETLNAFKISSIKNCNEELLNILPQGHM